MTRPRPSPAVIERVRALGEGDFVKFLDEVPPAATNALVDCLPTVPGFRKRSAAGIQQRKRALAKEFASNYSRNSPKRASVDQSLYAFWRAWALEHLCDKASTEALIKAIEEGGEELDEDTTSRAIGPIIALFSALRTRSLENKCSRETIERFFAFSPFDESSEIRSLIDEAKSSAAIERDVAMAGLPQRLGQDEEDIKSLEASLHQMSMRIDLSNGDVRKIQRDVAALYSRVSQLGTAHEEFRAALDAHAEAIRSSDGLIASRGRETEAFSSGVNERLSRLSADAKALTQTVQSAISQLGTAHEEFRAALDAQAEAIRSSDGLIASRGRETEAFSSGVNERLSQLSADAKALTQTVQELAAHSSASAFDARLAALEQDKENAAPEGGTQGSPIGESLVHFRPRRLLTPRGEKIAALRSFEDGVAILAANLERAGLKKSAARPFAEEICASAFIGQVVFFKGALATAVARLSALSLSGPNSVRLSMPIGVTDGEAFRSVVMPLSSTAGSGVPALVIEGINRSALDVFADAISDLMAGEGALPAAWERQWFVFASVTQGVASLPIEPTYLELGPVFDLDHLDWRLRRVTSGVAAPGRVLADALRAIRASLEAWTTDSEEALRILRRFKPGRNPRMESSVIAAYCALSSIERAEPMSALQSIAYGWLVPLWLALGLERGEVDSELDGGKCDLATPDPRLASILANGDFAPGKDRGS
jgi:hypothetical protein